MDHEAFERFFLEEDDGVCVSRRDLCFASRPMLGANSVSSPSGMMKCQELNKTIIRLRFVSCVVVTDPLVVDELAGVRVGGRAHH